MHLNIHDSSFTQNFHSKMNPASSRPWVEGQTTRYSHRSDATTLVVFDTQVADYPSLAAGVHLDAAVLILRSDQDGVQQITQALQASPSVRQLHIVSHGGPGYIELGDRPLSLATLQDYTWELQHWFSDRTAPGNCSIALYGCQVAAGDGGAEFVQALHRLTGASVAASTTLVGSADLGGNWDLDASVGTPKQELAIAPEALSAYRGTLVNLSFIDPSLVEGTENSVGAVYRFTNVTVDNGAAVDALVTVDAINGGATLENIDRPGEGSGQPNSFGAQDALQPRVRGAVGSDASVDFSIQFVEAGTETPFIVSSFLATILDLDGNDPTDTPNRGIEFAALANANEFTLLGGQSSELTQQNDLAAGFADVAFLGTTNQGDGFTLEASVTFAYLNSSGFRFRAGVTNYEEGSARQLSLLFDETILDDIFPPIPPVVVNEPPAAVNDTATTAVGVPVDISILANDTDAEDGIPSGGITQINGSTTSGVTSFTLPSGGIVELNPDNTVTYQPAPGFTGVDSFTYTVADSDGTNVTATVNVTVQDGVPPNTPPTANPDTAGFLPNTPVTLNLTANDTDTEDPGGTPTGGITAINGTPVVVGQPITLPSGSLVQLNPDGTVTYTPAPGLAEVEEFSYTVADSGGSTSTAIATLIPQSTPTGPDTDGDGVPDPIDLDDDNDGIPDTVEEQGNPDLDTDGDGIVDRLDLDSDNDGILDVEEAGHDVGDPDGDGRLDGPFGPNGLADIVETAPESGVLNYTVVDTDGDGVRDFQDLDSDNDGITDVVEGGGLGQDTDPDGDGIIGTGTPVDTDGDGIADDVDPDNGGTPSEVPDTDDDGQKDYRDVDTDNDGILDVVEQGAGFPDANGDGVVDGTDSDGDGILSPVDAAEGSFGSAPSSIPFPQDADGSGTPDWRELPIDTIVTPEPPGPVVSPDPDRVLNGFSDPDILIGGSGNDRINGGSDPDVLSGGAGDDIINGGSGNDQMDGGSGNDAMNGGSGRDRMLGRKGNDVMSGGQGRDRMRAGAGRDEVFGDAGRDELYGDRGRDTIDGGRGGDMIVGGFGADQLTGGEGRDRFVFERIRDFGDVIADFAIIKDRLVFDDVNGINSLDDLELKQRGADTVVHARINGGLEKVATLVAVEADTLDAANFSF